MTKIKVEKICEHQKSEGEFCDICNPPGGTMSEQQVLPPSERIERTVKCDVCGWYTPGVPQSEPWVLHETIAELRASLAQSEAERERLQGSQGEGHYKAKLTEDAVREIRTSTLPQKELAGKFGIAVSYVTQVKRGGAWKHVS